MCLLGTLAVPAHRPVAAQVTPEKAVRVSAGVMAGMVLAKQAPVYPPDAKAAGIQGAVVLSATITKTGTVENVQVVSGPEKLRDAAVGAASNWRYRPYELNGLPVAVSTTITINFSLGDRSTAGAGAAEGPDTRPAAGVAFEQSPNAVRVSTGVMAGLLLHKVAPVYPSEAKAARVSGSVVLHATISKTGTVGNLQVVSGPEMLRASAMDSVRQWIYKPYLLKGQPVDVETQIIVNYNFTGPQ
jgi:TonB family protein